MKQSSNFLQKWNPLLQITTFPLCVYSLFKEYSNPLHFISESVTLYPLITFGKITSTNDWGSEMFSKFIKFSNIGAISFASYPANPQPTAVIIKNLSLLFPTVSLSCSITLCISAIGSVSMFSSFVGKA